MTHELMTQDESREIAVIEANARAAFNDQTYEAQRKWHDRNEQLHRDFQDAIEDNAAAYRAALTAAQRQYRNATADVYSG